jgi:hypothetical protein
MQRPACPEVRHFHVAYEQIGSFKRPMNTVIAGDADEALALLIESLPKGWRGGVSVIDDGLGHEDEMPLAHLYV